MQRELFTIMQRISHSADETLALGEGLGRTAQPGDVLWLHGDLGAGKTEMTKGIATGVGAQDPVSSPSFALIHEYHGGRLPLFHIDLYRLETESALDLGVEDYLEGDGLTVIEWGERLPERYFTDGVDITLEYIDTGDERRLTLHARGPHGAAWLQRLTEHGIS